jgi:hypothetical protein
MRTRPFGNHVSGMRGPWSDRRTACADDLARALLHAGEPLSFDEIAARVDGAPVRDLAAWLGHAVEAGLIEEVGADRLSPRRFRLRPRGADVLTSARRTDDGQVAA